MERIAARDGYEVWAGFEPTSQVWQMYASETCEDWIGDADTLEEARTFAEQWITERIEER